MIPTQARKRMPALADLKGRLIWEKRREPRYPANDAAYVQVLPERALRVPATVIDVSRNGLRIKLNMPVPVHGHIQITIHPRIRPRTLVLFGEVRYCSRVRGYYHAGVLIRDVVAES